MRASGISSMQLLAGRRPRGLRPRRDHGSAQRVPRAVVERLRSEMRTQSLQKETAGVAPGRRLGFATAIESELRRQAGDSATAAACCCSSWGPTRRSSRSPARIPRTSSREPLGAVELRRDVVPRRTESTRAAPAKRRRRYSLNPNCSVSVVREDMLDTPALQRYIRYLEGELPRCTPVRDRVLDAAREHRVGRADDRARAAVRVRRLAVCRRRRPAARSARRSGSSYYVIGEVLATRRRGVRLDPIVVAWAPSAMLLLATLVAFSRGCASVRAATRTTRVPDSGRASSGAGGRTAPTKNRARRRSAASQPAKKRPAARGQ